MLRLRVSRDVRGRGHHDEPVRTGDGDGDHVLIEPLSRPYSGVIPFGHDVRRLVAHPQVHPDFGVALQESCEERSIEDSLCSSRDVEPCRPWGSSAISPTATAAVRTSSSVGPTAW